MTAVQKLKPANGLEAGATQCPLIDEGGRESREHIADAVGRGAAVMIGRHRHALRGRFFESTVLTGVTQEMLISREESFGPVAPLFPVTTDDEAIALANDTEFGLAAYFYGRDIGRVWRVRRRSNRGWSASIPVSSPPRLRRSGA